MCDLTVLTMDRFPDWTAHVHPSIRSYLSLATDDNNAANRGWIHYDGLLRDRLKGAHRLCSILLYRIFNNGHHRSPWTMISGATCVVLMPFF